jgi:coproporphyrinogen III oxidase-like Fe-S oxidoreductase
MIWMVKLYFTVYAITMLPIIASKSAPPSQPHDWLAAWGWTGSCAAPVSAYVHIPFCRHRCGYCNFSLLANRDDLFDRFLNAPGESLVDWKQDLQRVIELGVQHVSTYGLIIKKGARFWGMRDRSQIACLPEELELSLYVSDGLWSDYL